MDALLPALILLIGLALGWLIRRMAVPVPDPNAATEPIRAQLVAAQADAAARSTDLAAKTDQLAATTAELAAARADAHAVREQLDLVREDREQLVAQFKAQAGDVLKTATTDLARQQAERQHERDAQVERERKARDAEAEREQKARARGDPADGHAAGREARGV